MTVDGSLLVLTSLFSHFNLHFSFFMEYLSP